MQGAQITLPTGSVVKERYLIEDLLGKGGFGAVYLVRDQRVRGNLFALKEVIDPNMEDQRRFAFEGEVLKKLDHPALPRVYRIFEEDHNRLYMLMDYIEGPNLEQLRQQQPQKRFALSQVMAIMAPIVSAVSYLHQQQPPIIHRDIKPANIIVPSEPEKSVLVDFGIAKEYDQEGTTTAIRRCSPGYGAPEQYARGTNVQTDVYGLAATFYALLTGTIPADALYRMTQMGSRRADPLEPVTELAPGVPHAIGDIIHRAMAINLHDRFASVDAFWQALETALAATNGSRGVGGIAPISDGMGAYQSSLPPATTARRPRTVAPTPQTMQPSAEPFASLVPVAQFAPVVAPEQAKNIAHPISRSSQVEMPREGAHRRRRPLALFFFILIALALIAGLLFETGILPGIQRGVGTPTPVVKKTSVASAPTHAPTHVPTKAPTTPPTATSAPTSVPPTSAPPTSQPTSAPTTPPSPVQLHSNYSGSIVDAIGPTSATMQLENIVQNGTGIQGYFLVNSPLQGSNSFSGTVSSSTVNFTVQSYAGHLPLLFTGTVQTNGGISGTYCAFNGTSCDYSQGHGTWQVA